MKLSADTITVRLGQREIVRGACLDIVAGEIVAVIGPNGAGKSTLLRAMAGLIRPSAGRVTLDGAELAAMEKWRLARSVAFLPQQRTVGWPLSVRRVVALGRLPHAGSFQRSSAGDEAAVEAALMAMDLGDLADRRADQLSGGELARVLVARALAQEAPILIADEPTAGLDVAHVIELFNHLRRLAAGGRAIVVAVHDLSLALNACDRAVLMDGGAIRAAGPVDEVVTAENIAAAFGVTARVGRIDDVSIVAVGRRPGDGSA
ncbi:MAG: ABC transporter ATP-binding protein [Hyphomicrobiaceae bacterium]